MTQKARKKYSGAAEAPIHCADAKFGSDKKGDQGLLIIRGHNVHRFRKMDYTEHADAGKLSPKKVSAHIPAWYREYEDSQKSMDTWQGEQKNKITKVEDLFS